MQSIVYIQGKDTWPILSIGVKQFTHASVYCRPNLNVSTNAESLIQMHEKNLKIIAKAYQCINQGLNEYLNLNW